MTSEQVRMVTSAWEVVTCVGCGMAFGRRQGHQASCTRCGTRSTADTPVLETVTTTTELREAIAMANLPPELREPFQAKLRAFESKEVREIESGPAVRRAILNATEDGMLERSALIAALRKHRIRVDLEELLSQAEAEGILVRQGRDAWLVIE